MLAFWSHLRLSKVNGDPKRRSNLRVQPLWTSRRSPPGPSTSCGLHSVRLLKQETKIIHTVATNTVVENGMIWHTPEDSNVLSTLCLSFVSGERAGSFHTEVSALKHLRLSNFVRFFPKRITLAGIDYFSLYSS